MGIRNWLRRDDRPSGPRAQAGPATLETLESRLLLDADTLLTPLGGGFQLLTERDPTGAIVRQEVIAPEAPGGPFRTVLVDLGGGFTMVSVRDADGAELAVKVVQDSFFTGPAPDGVHVIDDMIGSAPLGGPVRLLTPAAPTVIQRGDIFQILWLGGDADTTLQLWAGSVFGWTMIGDNVPAVQGVFNWNTAPQAHGWYAIGAWVNDGGLLDYEASPNWVMLASPSNVAPVVTFVTPSQPFQVIRGQPVRITWNAFDGNGDPLLASLFAVTEQGDVFPIAEGIDGRVGLFNWDTTNILPGFYAFRIQVYDGSRFGFDASNDFIEIILPVDQRPTLRFLTPRSGDRVRMGQPFLLEWDFFVPNNAPAVVNLWAFSFDVGWFQLAANLPARAEQFTLLTNNLLPSFYAFGAWVGVNDAWTFFASDDWLQVLPAA